MGEFIDSTFFSFLFPIMLILCVAGGYYGAYRSYKRKHETWKMSGVETSIIGFFALLLSFTLLSAGNGIKERTNLIHQQSDGLAQLYRNTYFLPDTLQLRAKKYLLTHIELMLSFQEEKRANKDWVEQQINHNNEAFIQFLSILKKSDANKEYVATLLPSFNLLSASAFRILYSYEERTPLLVIILIIISSLLIAFLVGFMNGFYEKKHYLVPLIYIILVALTVQAIRDMDNPYHGSIKPSYQNIKNIKSMIVE